MKKTPLIFPEKQKTEQYLTIKQQNSTKSKTHQVRLMLYTTLLYSTQSITQFGDLKMKCFRKMYLPPPAEVERRTSEANLQADLPARFSPRNSPLWGEENPSKSKTQPDSSSIRLRETKLRR